MKGRKTIFKEGSAERRLPSLSFSSRGRVFGPASHLRPTERSSISLNHVPSSWSDGRPPCDSCLVHLKDGSRLPCHIGIRFGFGSWLRQKCYRSLMWEHHGDFLDLAQQGWGERAAEEKLETDRKISGAWGGVSVTTQMECGFLRTKTSAERT